MVGAGMVEIPAGRFRMGSVGYYPEGGGPRGRGGFAIDRGPVTVAGFARFAEETGYRTLAERPPEAADYPDADPLLLDEAWTSPRLGFDAAYRTECSHYSPSLIACMVSLGARSATTKLVPRSASV